MSFNLGRGVSTSLKTWEGSTVETGLVARRYCFVWVGRDIVAGLAGGVAIVRRKQVV